MLCSEWRSVARLRPVWPINYSSLCIVPADFHLPPRAELTSELRFIHLTDMYQPMHSDTTVSSYLEPLEGQ